MNGKWLQRGVIGLVNVLGAAPAQWAYADAGAQPPARPRAVAADQRRGEAGQAASMPEPKPAPTRTAARYRSINLGASARFASGSSEIDAGDTALLDALARALGHYPRIHQLELLGYTDDRGDGASHLRLSAARARAVRDYLVARGVDENSIAVRAMGSAHALASNATAGGRARNRRVEIRVHLDAGERAH